MAQQSDNRPLTRIDGHTFSEMSRAALSWLHTNHQTVNALNVFPVPDGDTGTNMLLTMQAACAEIDAEDSNSAAKVAHLLAHGALMGARGNSGVILSQIWRGLAQGLENMEQFGPKEFAKAIQHSSETAYRGVMRPVEGTILSVIKDASAAAAAAAEQEGDLRHCLQQIVSACEQSVERTPDLLPVLKQAGVVDAGGFGLQLLFEGMLRYLHGESVDVAPEHSIKPLDLASINSVLETIEPGQDWEVVLDLQPKANLDLDKFYRQIDSMGTSIQIGEGDDFLRVHIHLLEENRFKPIECAETAGTVLNVHMENLLHQLEEQTASAQQQVELQPGQILAIVVSPGIGFTNIFSAPAISVVPGHQTMNPSTQNFLEAFEDLPAQKVIILPNNANIVMAAEQAAELSTKEVFVIPTHTAPQGVAALLSFDPDGIFEEVCTAMSAGAAEVYIGEITTATRNVNWNDVMIIKGQFIGLHNGEITCVGDTPTECSLELLRIIGADKYELVTLYYGEETNLAAAEEIQTEIETCFPQLEVEKYPGGQRHYHYILSVE